MNELRRFKKSFFLGRLIWVVGTNRQYQGKRLRKTLRQCQIQAAQTLVLEPQQFIDMLSRGISYSILDQYEVIVVKGFDKLEPQFAHQFLNSIQTFRELQMGLAMRMILISGRKIAPELNEFERFKPVKICLEEMSEDPGDLNARVHMLIDQAVEVSGVSVVRLSERAAVFLEYYSSRSSSSDILELIILGLQRSDRRILRFRDFLPNLFSVSDDLSAAESRRN